jgi:hypothetical protein
MRMAACPMEEVALVAAVITLEHPLKPADNIKRTRLERMIVFMI